MAVAVVTPAVTLAAATLAGLTLAAITLAGVAPAGAEPLGSPSGSRFARTVTYLPPAGLRPAGATPARPATTATPGRHAPRPVPAPSARGSAKVVSLRPVPGATDVSTGSRIIVTLSAPPARHAPTPVLSPPVAGDWTVQGRTLTFTPETGYRPWSTEHVRLPRGLAASKSYSFEVGTVPLLRFQQALAELHYLPLRFGPTAASSALRYEATNPAAVRTTAQPGVFAWRYPNTPASLAALWAPGQDTVLTISAIMRFEGAVGLPTDGAPSEQVWDALAHALAHRVQDTSAYDYLEVSETLPENLVVWQNGKIVYQSPANTGVPGAQTPVGTWPVYERFESTTMAGTDPDGVSYDISGIPWVAYFNGGDAVHGFWRAGYGYPQSNGCVELPVDSAAVVWTMDPIGTLVTVNP